MVSPFNARASVEALAAFCSRLLGRVATVEQSVVGLTTGASAARFVVVATDAARLALAPTDGLHAFVQATGRLWVYLAAGPDWFGVVNLGIGGLRLQSHSIAGDGGAIITGGAVAGDEPLQIRAGGASGCLLLDGRRGSAMFSQVGGPLTPPSVLGGDTVASPAGVLDHVFVPNAAGNSWRGHILPSDVSGREEHRIYNAGPAVLTLLYDSGANANEGFLFRGDGRLQQGESASLVYDYGASRWRAVIHRNSVVAQADETANRVPNLDGGGPGTEYQNGLEARIIEVTIMTGGVNGGALEVWTGPAQPTANRHGTATAPPGANRTARLTAVVPPLHWYRADWLPGGADPNGVLDRWVETTL